MEIAKIKRNGLFLSSLLALTILRTISSVAQNKEIIRVNDKDVLNAVAFYEKDDLQKAKTSLETIIEKNDKNADAHYALGMVLIKLNKADDAEDEIEEAIKLNTSVADYHYGLARVYKVKMDNGSMFTKMSLVGDFRDELLAALKIDPNHRLAMINIIGYYAGAPSAVGGDLNKALELANRLLKLDEKQARIYLVQIYSAMNNDKKALEEVSNLIKIDEYTGRIFMIQGLKKKGESAKAEEQYKLIEAKYGNNPDYFAFFNDYGYFLLGLNRVDEAIDKLKKQVALAPKSANAHDSLGEALLKKGLLKESLTEYKKALEFNPNLKSAQEKVKEIEDKMND